MGQPAAKQGDQVNATDTHIAQTGSGAAVTASLPFAGVVNSGLSNDVNVMGKAAAVVGSTADNTPGHVPPPGTSFVNQPSNKATITTGSATVFIDGNPAARNADTATTCNDPADLPVGAVSASGTVMIG